MKRWVMVTAAFVAAVAVWSLLLPPRRTTLDTSWDDGSVRGLLHVHSRLSDGRGTLDEIAADASRAGLQFLVVTDHGDATRPPAPPSYRSNVLVLDAVEISTRGGHYVALGLPQAPYPLGGEARDVVDDVRRLGGFGIAAHPDSPKPELRWADWTLPVDGLEILNPDTSWRVHAFSRGAISKWLLLRALLAYPVRPAESIAGILVDAPGLRDQWMDVAQRRAVVAVGGADAHAKLALRDTEPGDNRFSMPIPGYGSTFESMSVRVVPRAPFSGEAASDAALLLEALRGGRVYVAVDGWAGPPRFQFFATNASGTAAAGGALAPGSPTTLHVRSNAPEGYHALVWSGRKLVADRQEPSFELPVGVEAGVYFVEIRRPGGGPAWITSNPIYVRAAQPVSETTAPRESHDQGRSLFDGRSTSGWSYESDRTSLAVVDLAPFETGARIRLRYGLSGGASIGQYSAAAVEASTGVEGFRSVSFGVRGEQPMRISVQVRAEVAGAPPERWERSVYVDTTEQNRVVDFADMRPVGKTHVEHVPAADVRAIMFVVDTTNSKPGASGRLWLGDVKLVR